MAEVNIQTVTLSGYKASVQGAQYLRLGTWDSYGIEQLQIVPGPEWTGLVIKAVFVTAAGTTPVVVPDSNLIDVPPEATAQALGVESPGMIVFSGVTAGVQRITCNLLYLVSDHAPIDGTAPDPTPDQWAQFVAMVQQYAQQASQSATEAAGSAASAADSKTQAAQSAAAAGKSAQDAAAELEKVQGAGSAALQAIGTAQSTAVRAVQDAQQTGVDAVQGAQTTATNAVQQAQQSAVQAVEQAGTTQVGAVNTAGQQQNTAIQQAGEDATKQVQDTGTEQVNAVTEVGNTKLEEIKEANAILPTPTEADAGKAPIAQPDGTYALEEVTVDAYTKAESDARYAPITAAIRPTVSDNPATLEHSVAWALQGLLVYGKSTQDGTPSPDNPVPIVSAGDAGSIAINVSNGADQSQQLIIQTPNGLPGIPISSGGNYTDADGQQWVCDEIDYETKKYVQNCVKVVLDGIDDENWRFMTTSVASGFRYFINLAIPPAGVESPNLIAVAMCDKFLTVSADATYNERQGAAIDNNMQFIIFCDAVHTNNITNWKNWLKENPVTLIYQIATPIETPLSDEKLAAYAALRSYNGTTIVSTEEPVAGLSARYVADGAAYIESKIQAAVTEAVTQAVALTGGNA